MASFVDILFNAAGGGVVGSLLHLGTSVFEVWRKKKDAEVEIMLLQAKMEAAEKTAAWDAFSKSQENVNAGLRSLPAQVHPIMANLFVGVDALRSATRPLLTWALLGVLLTIYLQSSQAIRDQLASEMVFGAFTAVFWWFGSRYSAKGR